MARPNVTLQPSKRTVTQAAAELYAAYIRAGWIDSKEGAEQWRERAVQEAIALARRVDEAVQSDEELPDEGKQRLRRWPDEPGYPPLDRRGE